MGELIRGVVVVVFNIFSMAIFQHAIVANLGHFFSIYHGQTARPNKTELAKQNIPNKNLQSYPIKSNISKIH